VFLKKGNAICLAGLREEAKLIQGLQQAERSAQNPGPGLHEHFVAKVLNAADGMISELSALPLPKGREDAAEEVIEDFESGLEKAKSSPSTYLSGQAFKPAEDAADAYGLAKCAV
jgi:hypothetical protein